MKWLPGTHVPELVTPTCKLQKLSYIVLSHCIHVEKVLSRKS